MVLRTYWILGLWSSLASVFKPNPNVSSLMSNTWLLPSSMLPQDSILINFKNHKMIDKNSQQSAQTRVLSTLHYHLSVYPLSLYLNFWGIFGLQNLGFWWRKIGLLIWPPSERAGEHKRFGQEKACEYSISFLYVFSDCNFVLSPF